MVGRHRARTIWLLVTLVLVVPAALLCGAVPIDLLHPSIMRTVFGLRLARIAAAALVGASVSLAGALLQTLLENPLVDPYIMGASAGAALAVALGIVLHCAVALLPGFAAVAALGATAATAELARIGTRISPERVILAGVSLSAICAAIVTMITILLPSLAGELALLGWLGGGLAGRTWSDLLWPALYAFGGTMIAFALAPRLNLLRLGRDRAAALGFDMVVLPWLIVVAAALLTAASVSLAGMIGFVGLLVPHATRRWIGGDARWHLPSTALLGAITLVVADTLARSVLPPIELPLGPLLAIGGIPAVLLLALRRSPANLL